MKIFIPFFILILFIGFNSNKALAQWSNAGFNSLKIDSLMSIGSSTGVNSSAKRGKKLLPVLANSFWRGSGNVYVKSDSAIYSYSNGRGGENIFQNVLIGNIYGCLFDGLRFDEASSWEYINQGYVPNNHIVKTWDAQNRLLSHTYQEWKNSEWVNYERTLYNYSNHMLIVSTDYWNTSSQSYIPSSKDSCTYNLSNQIEFIQELWWDNTALKWTNYNRNFYTFDNRGNCIENITQKWNATNSDWETSYKYAYSYNDSNDMSSRMFYNWDDFAKKWILYMGFRNTYDANYFLRGTVNVKGPGIIFVDSTAIETLTAEGDALTSTFYSSTSGSWKLTGRSTSTYLKPGLPIKNLDEQWTGSAWVDKSRTFLFYDNQDQLTDRYTEDWKNSAWVVSNSYISDHYYYDGNFSKISKVVNKELQVNLFPIPANNLLTLCIKWPSVQSFKLVIYDIDGKVCAQWDDKANGFYTKDISIADLKNGIYYMIVAGENNCWNSSFTVQR